MGPGVGDVVLVEELLDGPSSLLEDRAHAADALLDELVVVQHLDSDSRGSGIRWRRGSA